MNANERPHTGINSSVTDPTIKLHDKWQLAKEEKQEDLIFQDELLPKLLLNTLSSNAHITGNQTGEH